MKPGNVLLAGDDEPKVTDFGLSIRFKPLVDSDDRPPSGVPGDRVAAEDASAAFARAGIVGTIPYMSPEMAAGHWSDVSTASDIYGLGAILYTMLTAHAPFRGKDQDETLAQVVSGELTRPRLLNRKIDRELNAQSVSSASTASRPCAMARPTRCANDLRRWLEVRPTLAGGKPSAGRELRFWVRRNPRGLLLAGIAAVLFWVAGLAISLTSCALRIVARLHGWPKSSIANCV